VRTLALPIVLCLIACQGSLASSEGPTDGTGVAETGQPGQTDSTPQTDADSGLDSTTTSSDETTSSDIPDAPSNAHFVLGNARLPGGASVSIEVDEGIIVDVGAGEDTPPGVEVVDLGGGVVVPGFIDSHVHLAYHYSVEGVGQGRAALAANGIVGVVDLATPLPALPSYDADRWIAAGPMITAVSGYPTQSWGAAGYGLEVAGADAAAAAVDQLAEAGARVIKIPVDGGAALNDLELTAVVQAAHRRGLRVVAHALGDADAARAAAFDVDVLAHTPTAALSDATVALWSDRAVISTLGAFGGSPTAVDNLRRLHAAGTTVLYGTDFGNSQVEGIDAHELSLLAQAGLTPTEIVAAGTQIPATFWGMQTLGELTSGKSATLLVIDGDPADDAEIVAEPTAVWVDGQPVG